MTTFWELFRSSAILQAAMTLIIICVICYLVIVGRDVPGELWQVLFVIVGFYFGSKVQQVANTRGK